MDKRFAIIFNELEVRKRKLWQKVDSMDNGLLNRSPDSKSWSVIQVIDHLAFAENGSVRYCKKKLLAAENLKKPTLFHSARMSFFNLILFTPYRIKAPTTVSAPSDEKSLVKVKEEFENSRIELKSFLESFPDQYLDRAVYRHPLAGRITITQMLSFFEAHFVHHTYQIDRTIKQLS